MSPVWSILISLYIILCWTYAYHLGKKADSKEKGLYSLIIGLCLPFIGFIFLWYCDVVTEKRKDKNYLELLTKKPTKDELMFLQSPDTAQELNHVPMEDALKLNVFEYRRNMIMNLLNEKDTLQYIDVLQIALDNEDTETSHYASTIIMELQKNVQEELTEKEVLYEKNREQMSYTVEWEKILYKVLDSNLFDEQNKKRYFAKYERLSRDLLAQKHLDEIYYIHILNILLKAENYTEAELVCQRYRNEYPASEDAMDYLIQLYIKTKDLNRLQRFIEELQQEPLMLTKKIREYIHVFGKENELEKTH